MQEDKNIAQGNKGLIDRLFCAHPRSAGECYFRHLWFSLVTGTQMIFYALCLMLHGVFPFLCEKTASDYISRLHASVDARRRRTDAACGKDKPS